MTTNFNPFPFLTEGKVGGEAFNISTVLGFMIYGINSVRILNAHNT